MGFFIGKIQIEGFRGVNNEGDPLQIKLKTDKINSVFAPNGHCKSSVFEALSFALRGTVSKLDRLHSSEKPQEYYTNRFHSGRRATIVLTLISDTDGSEIVIKVERDATGKRIVSSPSGHSDPSGLLKSLSDETALLDYETFIRFVEESPLNRGRSFSSLLGLATFSQKRQALETLSNARTVASDFEVPSLEATLRADSVGRDQAVTQLRSAYQKLLGRPMAEPFDAATVVKDASSAICSIELLKPVIDGKTLPTIDFKAARDEIRKAEGGPARERLAAVLRGIATLEALAPGQDEKKEFSELKAQIEARDQALAKTRGSLFKTMYQGVQAVLTSADWGDKSKCPACESKPAVAPVEHIASCLSQFRAVEKAETNLRNQWQGSTCNQRFRNLEDHFFPAPHNPNRFHKGIDERVRIGHPTAADLETAEKHLNQIEQRRLDKLAALGAERDCLQKEIPSSLVALTEQIEHAEQLRDALNNVQKKSTSVATTKAKLDARLQWKSFIESTTAVFADAETAMAKHRISQIQGRFQQLHGAISGVSQIKPSLRKGTGSEDLFLRLEQFYSLQDASAVPLLNESYRNALAISIFLSAALESRGPARFMVFDDVTSSFDAGHQFALMEVLRTQIGRPNNPSGLQVVILSHDGLLEKYFDKMSGNGDWYHQKLLGNPPIGAVYTQAQDANRLRSNAEQFLKVGQVQQAEPLIRQYLEFKLLQIINKTRVPVPLDFVIRSDVQMVGNCVDAIQEAVSLQKKAGALILSPKQHSDLDKVIVPSLVANWLSHYGTAVSASLAPAVLLGVLATIDQFADAFMYDCHCNGATERRYYKSLEAKHCRC